MIEKYTCSIVGNNRVNTETEKIKDEVEEVNEININLSQLRRNYSIIKSLLKPSTKFMAILKGDAYNHGILPIAKELEGLGCDAFGIVRVSEAVALRKAGIQIPIYILAPIMPEAVDMIVTYDITIMVDDDSYFDVIDKVAAQYKKVVKVHLKVNTGLNRYGISGDYIIDFLQNIKLTYSNIHVEGIYTHFQNPDKNEKMSKEQIFKFNETLKKLEEAGLKPNITHASESAAILNYPEAQYDMVRCGLILFGLEHTKGEKKMPKGVKALMNVTGRVTKIRSISSGDYGGYGELFVADKITHVAVVSLGYADGIIRGWKEILIAGHRVKVINYFMDAILVDISMIKDRIKLWDKAVIIGQQGEEVIEWGEVVSWFNTYEDEQIQFLTQRVPRYYYYEEQ